MSVRIKKIENENERVFKNLLIELFSEKLKDMDFARKLYDCLCNTVWYNETTHDIYSCSFRFAGGLIADMRDVGEDYMDFYCNGFSGEGSYHSEIYTPLNENGYKVIPHKSIQYLQEWKFRGHF